MEIQSIAIGSSTRERAASTAFPGRHGRLEVAGAGPVAEDAGHYPGRKIARRGGRAP
jgi:hypothetical protein